MAKKLKKEIKKVLDKTDIDDKLVDAYQDAKASGLWRLCLSCRRWMFIWC